MPHEMVSPIREDVLPTPTASAPIPSPSPSANAAGGQHTSHGTPSRGAAHALQEIQHWRGAQRCFGDRLSPSPPRGATFGTGSGHPSAGDHSPERSSPGPGAYLCEPASAGKTRGSSIPHDHRWKEERVTPGPGEYFPKSREDGQRIRSEGVAKGLVFGSTPQRQPPPAASPGPGTYAAGGEGPRKAAPGGTFGKSRREASRRLDNPTSLSAASRLQQGLAGVRSGSRRGVAGASAACSFGTSHRFKGYDSYTERAEVPGPGEYNLSARTLEIHTKRSRTPPAFRPIGFSADKGRRAPVPAAQPPQQQQRGVRGPGSPSAAYRRSSSLSTTPGTARFGAAKSPVSAAKLPRAAAAPEAVSPAVVAATAPIPITHAAPSVLRTSSPQRLPSYAMTSPPLSAASVNAAVAAVPTLPSMSLLPTPLSPTPGERAWRDFCTRCRAEGLDEEELVMLSLDTLKTLMKQVNVTDVVDAARIEVQWKQLRLARKQLIGSA